MGTLTIRNLPNELIGRIKQSAQHKGVSMEQEVRELLQSRYASRKSILLRIRERWEDLPDTSSDEIQRWRVEGRP